LTDVELRAAPVFVEGPLTDTEMRASPVEVTGPLTATELHADPIAVDGPLTNAELRALAVPVDGPLTDAQLRAAAVLTDLSPATLAALETINAIITGVGTGATDLGKIEDAGHASGDVGVMALGVRNDQALGTLAGTDLDYAPIAVSSTGAVFASIAGTSASLTDGHTTALGTIRSASGGSVLLATSPALWNGTSWERERSNVEGIALASGARTTTQVSPDITTYNARGIIVWLNVSVASGTGGLITQVQIKDPASGLYTAHNAAPPGVTTVSRSSYIIYPGASAAGATTQTTSNVLPRTIRIAVTHIDGSSYTYSVGYCLIP
jgi:hypothetical protein